MAIVLAMSMVILITMIAISTLRYIIPFWKNTKWIENSSTSYYQSISASEDALWFINQNTLWSESWATFPAGPKWNSFDIIAMWNILPPAWKWNSIYDNNHNLIAPWFPIQLEVWNNTISEINFKFRAPDISWWWAWTLSWSNIINWQLSSALDTLNASWSYITSGNINTAASTNLFTKNWVRINWIDIDFGSFYGTNCNLIWKLCTLKLSIISKLELDDGTPIPYIEWQANVAFWESIPLQNIQVNTSWKSYGFRKNINLNIPIKTTIEAFDFTIFQ